MIGLILEIHTCSIKNAWRKATNCLMIEKAKRKAIFK